MTNRNKLDIFKSQKEIEIESVRLSQLYGKNNDNENWLNTGLSKHLCPSAISKTCPYCYGHC